MRHSQRLLIYSLVFFALINLPNTLNANESIAAQMKQAEKNYEALYRKMKRRIIHNLAYKGRKLSKILRRFGYKNIKVSIYNSPLDSPSALCYPEKKHIFVSVELLSKINYEDEIAFIMAHELSHVVKNHRYSRKEKLAFFKGTQALGKASTDAVISLAEEHKMLMHRYAKEFSADKLALSFIKPNYSTKGSTRILRRLGKSLLDTNTNTHPAISARIKKIKQNTHYRNNRRALTKNSTFKARLRMSQYRYGIDDIDKDAIKRAVDVMNDYYQNNEK